MRKKRVRRFLYFFVAGIAFFLLYEAYLEFYYYRDRVDWLFPLSAENGFLIRKDRWGRGDFGARRNGGRRHQGVDLLAKEGSLVFAVRSGRVRVGNVPNGMGKFVTITHRDGTRTIYGHLSDVRVKDHSRVRQGEIIGSVGRTGNASAEGVLPHLHFEMREEEKVLNPTPVLLRASANVSTVSRGK